MSKEPTPLDEVEVVCMVRNPYGDPDQDPRDVIVIPAGTLDRLMERIGKTKWSARAMGMTSERDNKGRAEAVFSVRIVFEY